MSRYFLETLKKGGNGLVWVTDSKHRFKCEKLIDRYVPWQVDAVD